MGTRSEIDLVKKHLPFDDKVVLEIGTAAGYTRTIRDLTKAKNHIGLDMQEGEYVNLVHDLNDPIPIELVDAIFCFSVLEHCNKPWIAAGNLSSALKQGGLLLLSVPFQWRVHGYPNDYWRFTPHGVKELFPDIAWIYAETDPPSLILTSHQNQKVLLLFAGIKQ